jgi:hypothetical protein
MKMPSITTCSWAMKGGAFETLGRRISSSENNEKRATLHLIFSLPCYPSYYIFWGVESYGESRL